MFGCGGGERGRRNIERQAQGWWWRAARQIMCRLSQGGGGFDSSLLKYQQGDSAALECECVPCCCCCCCSFCCCCQCNKTIANATKWNEIKWSENCGWRRRKSLKDNNGGERVPCVCLCVCASVTGQQNLNAISSCCFGPRLYPCQCPRAPPRARAGD